MSNPTRIVRGRRALMVLALCLALLAVPVAAQASPVGLGTVSPFVVLGGQTVTNTGPSVLNGDLGVAPGTALPGFDLPAVVNGATHANDAVAAQAQADLTVAYDVAAGQPVAPADDLTGQDLGGKTLVAGAYRYASSAQLTGTVTLDAQGDPGAQFVFIVGSQLTTASASTVALINGASPCNVHWKVDTAVLGSTTAFQGNVMALTSISLGNAATVLGRLLARNGQVSLINNVLTRPSCATSSTLPPPSSGGPGTPGSPASPGGPSNPSALPPGPIRGFRGSQTTPAVTRNGTAIIRRVSRSGRVIPPRVLRQACTDGFRATVRGRRISRVVFSLDGKRIASRGRSPFTVSVHATPGRHNVKARISFTDATRTKTMTLPYRACAAQVLQPRRGPSQFTG
jgi:Ice-binding-like